MKTGLISRFTSQRCVVSYSLKAFLPAGKQKDVFREARETVLARLEAVEGCAVSATDVIDDSVVFSADDTEMKVVDLSSRGRWTCRSLTAQEGPAISEEMTLITEKDRVLFYFTRRLALDGEAGLPEDIQVPDLVLACAQPLGLTDGLEIVPRPYVVTDEEWAKSLWPYLDSPSRTMSVCLLIEKHGETRIDPQEAALNAFGFCHVVVLPERFIPAVQSRRASHCRCVLVPGTAYFVYPGWCIPKRETHALLPFSKLRGEYAQALREQHGLDLSPLIETDTQLLNLMSRTLPSGITLQKGYVSFEHIENGLSLIKKPKQEKQLEKRIEALESALGEVEEVATKSTEEAKTLEQMYEELETENAALRSRITQLEDELLDAKVEQHRLTELLWVKKPEVALEALEYPDSYDKMQAWCEHHLKGKLVLHPRAVRELKDARYHDVQLVYKALRLLGEEYREMRLGSGKKNDKPLRRAFADKMCELHLGYTARDSACHQYEGYEIEYPVGSGRKFTLESHLKRGKTFDPTTCLRIYFVWDAENKVVIVGSLPKHLRNSLT